MSGRAGILVGFDEVRRVARSRWTLVIIVAIWIATFAEAYVGRRAYEDRLASHLAARQAKVEDQLRTKQPVGRSLDPGLRVLRPSPVGLVLVEGQESIFPSGWDHGPAGAVSLVAHANIRRHLGGLSAWDLSYLVTVLGSLAALAAGFGSVWAHRLSGWAAAAASFATPPTWQAVGQLAGGQVVVAAAVGIWVVAELTTLALLKLGPLSSDILQMAPVVWLLLSLFYTIGFAIAAAVRSPAKAWPTLLLVWLGTAAVGSSLPTVVADALYPVSADDVWHREQADAFLEQSAEHEAQFVARLSAGLPKVSREIDQDAAADKQFQVMDGEWQAHVREIRRIMRGLEHERAAQFRRQHSVASWLSHFVPGAAGHAVMAELAGTGRSTVEAWEDATRRYHQELTVALFDDRPIVNLRVAIGDRAYQMGFIRRRIAPQYADLPAFEPPTPSAASEWRAATPYLVSLSVWWLIAGAVAIVSRVRMARA